jgi:hypothetical protein
MVPLNVRARSQICTDSRHPAPRRRKESAVGCSEIDTIDLDVLVLGDDRQATDLVQALAARIPGARGIYAGRLRNCGQVEALTANLVSINRRYKAHGGLRITDI